MPRARAPRMRPYFTALLPDEGTELFVRLRARLREPDAPFVGEVLKNHAYVRLPRERRSLLSPNLNLELQRTDDGVVLSGRFTPHPSVWMAFMGVFGVLAMLGLAGLMYGLAQMSAKETPWALLAAPVALGLIAFVYGASFIGQGLSADEMYELRAFVERVLRETEGERPE